MAQKRLNKKWQKILTLSYMQSNVVCFKIFHAVGIHLNIEALSSIFAKVARH